MLVQTLYIYKRKHFDIIHIYLRVKRFLVMTKISCEPHLHVLKTCHLNDVDRLVNNTILSD